MNAVHAMQPGVQRVLFDVELLGCLCNGEPVFTDACKALADHLLEFWVVSCSLVGHEYFLLAARTGLAALYRYTGALTKKTLCDRKFNIYRLVSIRPLAGM